MNADSPHLTEDEIVRAVVDETDLSPGQRRHLESCRTCRIEKERLEHRLSIIWQLSRQEEASNPSRTPWRPPDPAPVRGWRQPLTTGILAVAMVIVVLWLGFFPPEQNLPAASRTASQPIPLPIEAPAASEWSAFHQYVTGSFDPALTGSFEEFLVPTGFDPDPQPNQHL